MTTPILDAFKVTEADLLGEGGEAQVYALDDARVVRIYGEGGTLADEAARTDLLAEIRDAAQHLPFETPQVLEVGEKFGRIYAIEKRLPGTSLLQALKNSSGSVRTGLITQYMDAAWQLGTLNIESTQYGEINHKNGLKTTTLQAYLAGRARHNLTIADHTDIDIDTDALAASMGEPPDGPAFVHLDYFAGNVMADGDRISAVIDFGYSSIIGDRRMNAVAAAVHLMSPRITPTVIEDDRNTAMAWLRERDLLGYYEHGEPWMACYWAFVPEADDPAAYHWCRSILEPYQVQQR